MTSYFNIHNPPIPIVPNIPDTQIQTATLSHSWTEIVNTKDIDKKAKFELPVCHVNDIELLLHCIHEFFDVSSNNRLHLSTGAARFAKFRECLRGTPRDRWDSVLEDRTADGDTNTSVANFADAITNLIAKYLIHADLDIQEEYLLTGYKKKFTDDLPSLNDRLTKIERLCRRFPSHNDTTAVVFSERKLKNFFFNIMLPSWQKELTRIGHNWGDTSIARQTPPTPIHSSYRGPPPSPFRGRGFGRGRVTSTYDGGRM